MVDDLERGLLQEHVKESSVPNSVWFRVALLCVVNMNTRPNTSRNHCNIVKYGAGKNERGLDVQQRQPSKD